MRTSVLSAVCLLLIAIGLRAQSYDASVRNLSDEEIRLIQAYRRDPEPFRRLLYEREERAVRQHRGPVVLGPRDVIDVAVEGGSVAFFGRNYAYEPLSFRISRGQEIQVVFRRQRSSSETRVIVAYRSDGLHFDVPDQRPDTRAQEHGYLVLNEDPRWERGEAIEQGEKINGKYSHSKADHLSFRIRYASSR